MSYYFFQCQKCAGRIDQEDINHSDRDSTIYCKKCRDVEKQIEIPSVPSNEEIQKLQRRISELENNARIQEHHFTVIRQRNNEQSETIKTLEKEKKVDLLRIRTLELQTGKLNGEIESFKMRNSNSIQRIRSLTDELKKERLKNQLPISVSSSSSRPSHILQEENRRLKNEIDGLKSQARAAEENLNSVLSTMGSNQGPLTDMMKKLQESSRRKEMLETAVKGLQAGRKEQMMEYNKKMREMEAEKNAIRAKSAQEVEMIRKKVVELDNRLVQTRMSSSHGSGEMNKLLEHNKILTSEVEKTKFQAEKEKMESNRTHLQLCKILKDLKEQMVKLREENKRLRGAY